jgi:hypothetical protein
VAPPIRDADCRPSSHSPLSFLPLQGDNGRPIRIDGEFISAGFRVAIQEISRDQFGALKVVNHCRAHWPEKQERAWFIDTSQKLVGCLLYNAETGYWGYSICCYREDGEFHRIAVGSDFLGADRARLDLVANMRRMAPA